jgi:UDP-N-acetylglucosamine--N-acetylmuramyl-(pentapeptide) pyrophosphoryl-undecaprenol N-acetylglucosamine transferase
VTFVVAAAGTGGHVLPALTIAGTLREGGVPASDIVFFGGDRFEATAVPDAGYAFHGFPLTKLRRSLSPRNLAIPFVLRSTSRAMAKVLGEVDASVVLGMSGYVTVPAAMAARRAGVPFVVHEQNAGGTLAARWGARHAVVTLLGLPGEAERMPRSLVVGNPLRPALTGFDRSAMRPGALARYGIDHGPVIGIIGGSLGAQVLNEAAAAIAAAPGVGAVVHLTGPAGAGLPEDTAAPVPWIRRPYEPEMQHFYAAVDLVVCRAGAMTVSELAATGTPSVLVPLERVGQTANARVLEAAGAGVIVPQPEVAAIPGLVGSLVGDPPRLAAMRAAALATARTDAADRIAGRLMEIAGG